MNVIIGGTFGYLHKGHIALLTKAFEIGDYVYIGLTTDRYVKRLKNSEKIPSYADRKKLLDDFVSKFKKRYEIVPLEDKFGPSTTGKFDAIVVTDETLPTALEINRIRKESGLGQLCVVKIDYVLASDSVPISTTRIIEGEIDREGKLIKKGQAP